MMNMEEEIWDYIDGNCSPEEVLTIEAKIAADPAYKALYLELSDINAQMAGMDLEEPSMSFTRNVMEQVKLEIAPVSLKTKVDTRIIYSLSAFFVCAILGLIGYVLANSSFHVSDLKWNTGIQGSQIDFSKYITPTFIKIFLFVDLLLALAYFDSFLRRKRARSADH